MSAIPASRRVADAGAPAPRADATRTGIAAIPPARNMAMLAADRSKTGAPATPDLPHTPASVLRHAGATIATGSEAARLLPRPPETTR